MHKHKNLSILLVILLMSLVSLLLIQNNTRSIKNIDTSNQSATAFSWKPYVETPRGIYVTLYGSTVIPDYVLGAPGVSGIFLTATWKNLEKNGDDIYVWDKIDNQLQQIYDYNQTHGTNIRASVGISAGKYLPDWVIVNKGTFSEIPLRGASNILVNYDIPAPYESVFSDAFVDLIKDFADHLKSEPNLYDLTTTIKVTGLNVESEEIRLPYQENLMSANGLLVSADNPGIWQNLGYTSTKAKSVYRKFLNAFASNFPDKAISTAIIPDNAGFPNLDENGQKYSVGTKPDPTIYMIGYGYKNFPNQNVVQFNGLTPIIGPGVTQYMQTAKNNGGIWGYQISFRNFGEPSCVNKNVFPPVASGCDPTDFLATLNAGVADGASFIEIFPLDLVAFPSAVTAINNILTSPSPLPPANIKITNIASTSATVSWQESRDFDFDLVGYNIYSGTPNFTNKINNTNLNSTSYTFSGLLPNTTYSYKIKAIDNDSNVSEPSGLITFTTKDIQAPTAPSGLQVGVIKPGYVEMQFTHSIDDSGVNRYFVSRNGALKGKIIGSLNMYIDSDVVPGQTYVYSIKAVDKTGNVSSPSNNLSVTIPLGTGADISGPNITTVIVDGTLFKGIKNGNFGANDSSFVGPVSVFIDDVLVDYSSVKKTSFSFDTAKFTDGSHLLTIKCFDNSANGNSGSISRQVIVDNASLQ